MEGPDAADQVGLLMNNDYFTNILFDQEGVLGWFVRRPRRWIYVGVPMSALLLLLLYCARCKRRGGRSGGRVAIPEASKKPRASIQLQPAVFPTSKQFEAYCTAVDGERNVVWLQAVDDDLPLFEAIYKDIQAKYSDDPPSAPENLTVGDFYMFPCPRSGAWVRGRLAGGEGGGGRVTVEYVDHGSTAEVPASEVRELLPIFGYLPCKAVACQLDRKSVDILAGLVEGHFQPVTRREEKLKSTFLVVDSTTEPPTVSVKVVEAIDSDPSKTVDSGIEKEDGLSLSREIENGTTKGEEEEEEGEEETLNGSNVSEPAQPTLEDDLDTETQDASLIFDESPPEEEDGKEDNDGLTGSRKTPQKVSVASMNVVASPSPPPLVEDTQTYKLKEQEVIAGKYFVRGNSSCPIVLLGPDGNGSSVTVIGSFNDWSEVALQRDGEGQFSLSLDLPVGEHRFYFLVDGRRTHDTGLPTASENGSIVNYVTIEPLECGGGTGESPSGGEGSIPGGGETARSGISAEEGDSKGFEEDTRSEVTVKQKDSEGDLEGDNEMKEEPAVALEKDSHPVTTADQTEVLSADLSWGIEEDDDF